eukprot:6781547-Alexandrium_andersonii.AAC.1
MPPSTMLPPGLGHALRKSTEGVDADRRAARRGSCARLQRGGHRRGWLTARLLGRAHRLVNAAPGMLLGRRPKGKTLNHPAHPALDAPLYKGHRRPPNCFATPDLEG